MKPTGKQLNQLMGQVGIVGPIAAPAANSLIVTALFAGKTSGGNNTTAGVFTTGTPNKVLIRLSSNGKGIYTEDDDVNQVFGRLTESVGVWTVSFYTLKGSSENAFTFAGHSEVGNNLDILYGEAVQIGTLQPTTIMAGIEGIDEIQTDNPLSHIHLLNYQDVSAPGQTSFTLPQTPKNDASVKMLVNGIGSYKNGTDYTVIGTAIVWQDVDFVMETTDKILFDFEY